MSDNDWNDFWKGFSEGAWVGLTAIAVLTAIIVGVELIL